ncbi:MAG: AAA family ATPase, partial [Deltaproteobacteria bacterium]|nr:AAA family ATPase [Deltaproteobacteria bacterium]
MELLEGKDARVLAPVPFRDSSRLLRDVASSLALLHSRGFVHRDVSAGNVRRTEDGSCKLLDFGAMCAFGVPADVVGTPPYVPPEFLSGAPLDQRADLYALGALGYFLLTGHHAYPARSLPDLPGLWVGAPLPPSHFSVDVPPDLDDLVLSLLQRDPLKRPASAAEVIRRLGPIAGSTEADEAEVAASYLMSPVLVGRAGHLERVSALLEAARRGRGGSLVFEGAPGLGKTRILAEALVAAGLHGLASAHADGGVGTGSYRVVRALIQGLMQAADGPTRARARACAGIAAHLVPALASPGTDAAPLPDDPAETRARMQAALLHWFCVMADLRPLLLTVDNLDRADEASAALLSGLATEASSRKLALATALDPAAVSAPPGVAALRRASTAVPLERLSSDETVTLLRTLFGDGPNVVGLSALVHQLTFGAPAGCLTIARHLMAAGIAVYRDGSWGVPRAVTPDDMPPSLTAVIEQVVEHLSPGARRVGEFLAVARRDLALASLEALVGADELFAALGELTAKAVVVSSGERYRLSQAPFRELLGRSLSEP